MSYENLFQCIVTLHTYYRSRAQMQRMQRVKFLSIATFVVEVSDAIPDYYWMLMLFAYLND